MATSFVGGCIKDTGNYNYRDINDTWISGLDSTNGYVIYQFDTLKIDPNVKQRIPNKDSLDYTWSISNSGLGNSSVTKIISTQRSLVEPIAETPGNYTLVFKVTNRNTNISSFARASLTILSSSGTGWLVLNRTNSKSLLDIIRDDGRLVRDINAVNGTYSQPPKKLFCLTSGSTFSPESHIYLFSENDGMQLSGANLFKISDYPGMFIQAPSLLKPEYYVRRQSPGLEFLQNNGDIYIKSSNTVSAKLGQKALIQNSNYKSGRIIVAPNSLVIPLVIYDELNGRFLYMGSGFTPDLLPFMATPNAVFDMNNIGNKTLVHFDKGASSRIYSILKDRNNEKLFFYSFALSGFVPSSINAPVSVNEIPVSSNMTNASTFAMYEPSYAINNFSSFIYYAIDNNIWMYNTINFTSQIIYQFPSGSKISVMKMRTEGTSNNIYVGVNNTANEGSIYKFSFTPTGFFTGNTYTSVRSGFGAIVDIAYKDR